MTKYGWYSSRSLRSTGVTFECTDCGDVTAFPYNSNISMLWLTKKQVNELIAKRRKEC
jgi:hypothetical protein